MATKVGADENGIGYVSLSTDFAANGVKQMCIRDRVCTGEKLDPAQGAPLAAAVLSQDPLQIRDACCASGYILPKLKSKIARISRP